ncbi:hypothetical protein BSL78_23923 [Apostichopus japonicus]|uniref:Uncharacterized protein n=1 Tax=Stichopus japonicus TaxID=307972 RepID=A0A2G8JTZ8_STIJA|nr:hypothetical protein BSL78_23923 [Apostichopus japonicus]
MFACVGYSNIYNRTVLQSLSFSVLHSALTSSTRTEETTCTEREDNPKVTMVYTKGSRFGVFSGHTVRRPTFSYSQLCADQHIVIQSSKSFKRGNQVSNDIHLSMNKKNDGRWQIT